MPDYQTAALGIALAQGPVNALAQAQVAAATALGSITTQLDAAKTALASAQASLGASTPVTIGTLSIIDQRSQTERAEGKAAAVVFIKANPTCSEDEAIAAWNAGASPTLPANCTHFLNNAAGLLEAYIINAQALGATPDTTWASFAAFIVATPETTLLGM